ncbi:MAG TPA: sigma-70 family RNA polymerase sigma factor [Candidatus Limnocylindria bacterium]|nr:sigma-70 family RNA polymerase sigma factor [Candidatus Limnocylindria bacterium]
MASAQASTIVALATLGRVRELETADVLAASSSDAAQTVIDLELQHGQALFGFVRRQGLSDSEAEDAVQEVLLRVWRELRAGNDLENPRAWAYRAIYRLAIDQHRLRRRLLELSGKLRRTVTTPSEADTDERAAVWAEVDRLPPRQRQVLYLRYRSDLPFEAIASVLGITPSAARSHAAQAMAVLRRRLSTEDRE